MVAIGESGVDAAKLGGGGLPSTLSMRRRLRYLKNLRARSDDGGGSRMSDDNQSINQSGNYQTHFAFYTSAIQYLLTIAL